MSTIYFDRGAPATPGGRKVMLATPSYGNPACAYTFAMARSREALHRAGIATAYLLVEGHCHVDDARNAIVRDFFPSDCGELVFLDADVSWEPESLVALCGFDCDVVGGVYPYRRENDGENLPVRGLPDAYTNDGLIEVEGLPTGFLRIRRHVLERMSALVPKFHGRNANHPPTPLLFERDLHGDGRRSADIRFCMKWREMGGKVYAACELELGHTGGALQKDSLGAWLRRKAGVSLRYLVEEIRAGRTRPELFGEARRAVDNPWAAQEDVLSLCALVEVDGPILEAGSGLSTIVLAAAHPEQTVYCLEDDPTWAEHLKRLAAEAGVTNIGLCRQPIKGGWYDLSDLGELPEWFALGLNDGPARAKAPRMGFFEHFGKRVGTIICDDADDPGYRAALIAWSKTHGRPIDFVGERAALIRLGTA